MKSNEIKKAIDTIIVCIDSREHLPNHITDCLDKHNIKWERRKLNSGDYTARVPINEELGIFKEIDLEDILCIERKMSAEELSGNISTNRERFKREFKRSKAKIILVIENTTYKKIAYKDYDTQLTPNQYLGGLHSICNDYEVPFIFVDKDASALMIYNFLKYKIRSILKNL